VARLTWISVFRLDAQYEGSESPPSALVSPTFPRELSMKVDFAVSIADTRIVDMA
jgi:hypothetical protein